MFDAIVSGASIFEPQEAATLRAAFHDAARRISASAPQKAELAKIVHNLGRTRLRLKKPMDRPRDIRDLADEALELYDYLREQTLDLSPPAPPPSVERKANVFPASYAAPVVSAFRFPARG